MSAPDMDTSTRSRIRNALLKSKLMIRNLPENFNENDLRTKIALLGDVVSIKFCCTQKDAKTFAVVQFRGSPNQMAVQNLARQEQLLIRPHSYYYQPVPICGIHMIHNTETFFKTLDSCEMVEDQIEYSVLCSETSFNEKLEVVQIMTKLRQCIKKTEGYSKKYADCCTDFCLEQYGSRVNNLALKGADVDVSLETQKVLSTEEKICLCMELKEKLRKDLDTWSRPTIIPSRICPLVTLTHKASGLHIDLSVNNSRALHNSRVLRMYTREKRYRSAAIVAKLWAEVKSVTAHGLQQEPKISSYVLSNLVLFSVLQGERSLVPRICELESKVKDSSMVDVEGTEYLQVGLSSKLPPPEDRSTSCTTLVENFFHMMSTFDWADSVINLYDGSVVGKADLMIKPEYSMLKISTMTVVDPWERCKNLTANILPATHENFVQVCAEALMALKAPVILGRPWGVTALLERPLLLPVSVRPKASKRCFDEI